MDRELSRTQWIAVGLILSAALCIAIGERYGWRDLVGFATMFGGAGVGILTGQSKNSVTSKDGSTLNMIDPTAAVAAETK